MHHLQPSPENFRSPIFPNFAWFLIHDLMPDLREKILVQLKVADRPIDIGKQFYAASAVYRMREGTV